MSEIRNRIRGHRRVRAGDLLPHELNYRLHPEAQRQALKRSIERSASPAACWPTNCRMAGSSSSTATCVAKCIPINTSRWRLWISATRRRACCAESRSSGGAGWPR